MPFLRSRSPPSPCPLHWDGYHAALRTILGQPQLTKTTIVPLVVAVPGFCRALDSSGWDDETPPTRVPENLPPDDKDE